MTDEDRFLAERLELLGDVVGDLGHAKAGDGGGVLAGRLGGRGIAWPAGGGRLVAPLAEELHPAVPGFGVKPEAVNEDGRDFRCVFGWHMFSLCSTACLAAVAG